MLTMIGKRLIFAIPSLIGVVIVTFLLTRALPGDPAAYFAGPAATKEAVEQIRKNSDSTSRWSSSSSAMPTTSPMAISATRSPPASRSRPKSAIVCRLPPS